MTTEQTESQPKTRPFEVRSDALLALRIRDCISQREFITSAGNHEIASIGAWQSNWYAANNEIEQELADLWKQANAEGESRAAYARTLHPLVGHSESGAE